MTGRGNLKPPESNYNKTREDSENIDLEYL